MTQKYHLIILFVVAFAQAGFIYEYWAGTTDCSGGFLSTYKAENNDCGTTNQANEYSKITYEVGADTYHIYVYKDAACANVDREHTVKREDVGKGIKHTILSSYKFTLTLVCFPGESEVQLSTNESVKLKDLNVGQSIAAFGEKYSEVYAFLDHQPDTYFDFLELNYIEDSGLIGKLPISHEHLVLARRMGGEQKFVQAKDVKMGDYIYKNTNGILVSVEVTSLTVGRYKGAIAPATMDGTLIVDGIVTSSYAAINHGISHAVLAPLRMAYRLSPSLLPKNNAGLHPYTKYFYEMFFNYLQRPSAFYLAPTLDS